MSMRRAHAILALTCIVISGIGTPLAAQQPARKVPFRSRGVDLVILKDGTRLLGTVLPGDDTALLVRRQWLTTEAGDFCSAEIHPALQAENHPAASALEAALQQEVDKRQQAAPHNIEYVGLLRETLARLGNASRAPSPWLILTIPRERVQRIQTQQTRPRTVGFLAILNQIDGAESRSWQDLSRDLTAIPESARVTGIPEPIPEGDQTKHVNGILSGIDLRLGKSRDFIQLGSQVVAEDNSAGVEELVPLLLSGTVRQQLQELLSAGGSGGAGSNSLLKLPELAGPPPEAWVALAESGIRTARVSAFGIDLNSGRATARIAVYRGSEDSPPQLITQTTASTTVMEVNPEQAEAIGDDDRIRQIEALFSALGSSRTDLSRALRLGAALQSAVASAESQLQDQVDNILQGRSPHQKTPPPDRLTLTSPQAK